MASLLLAVIYLAAVSLGLPDSLLGSAWPVLHLEIGADISAAGLISMIISACTVISALCSDLLTRKLGAGLVTALSVLLSAASLLLFSLAESLPQLCLLAVPYGLAAGAIDSCLNNYIALHYSARHMSWLHCFWGVGATVSPYIMGFSLAGVHGWRGGYRLVSGLQAAIMLVMFLSLPLWLRRNAKGSPEEPPQAVSLPDVLRLPGIGFVLSGFFCYCAMEVLPFVWASTYFSTVFRMEAETAAFMGSLFYIGMTVSRGITGFFAARITDRRMIRGGMLVVIVSAVLICLSSGSPVPAVCGFVLIGIGCGPVYPAIVHSTPQNFGREFSGAVIGVQMAFAYTGSTISPFLFGKLASCTTVRMFPYCIIGLSFFVLLLTELLNRSVDRHRPAC